MSATTLDKIEATLAGRGERFTGADVREVALDWLDYNFDADDVGEWCDVGVWDPATAAIFREAGFSPADVQEAAATIIEAQGETADPVYAVCNGDLTVEEMMRRAAK